MSNLAKGRNSYDSIMGSTIVEFFNRNSTPYPTESGAPKFDLVPVEQQKDVMLNVARLHGQQEYQRIMELVNVLQNQANSIKRRLEITDWIHGAKYDFQIANGKVYWLLFDTRHNCTRLSMQGPNDWFCGKPIEYEYISQVKWLGDYTWIEVENDEITQATTK